jgi:hypothetical protein
MTGPERSGGAGHQVEQGSGHATDERSEEGA